MAWWAFRSHWISRWWLAVPAVAFVVVAVYHSRVLRARRRALRAVAVYQRGLARIEDRWMGGGVLASDSATRNIYMPRIWTYLDLQACSRCCRQRARAWEKARWHRGCYHLRR